MAIFWESLFARFRESFSSDFLCDLCGSSLRTLWLKAFADEFLTPLPEP